MTTVHYRAQMSSSDAIIWNIERDPQLRSTVMAVWLLDRVPSPERMAANTARMIEAIPRLRQRVDDRRRGRPTWVRADVDLSHHYVEADLPDGSGLDDVLRFAESWVAEPFDRARPQWRLGLLRGLADGRAAIVIKVHHAIADGMGMVLMLGAFTDLERDPAPTVPSGPHPAPAEERVAYSSAQRWFERARGAWRAAPRQPLDAVRSGARTAVSASRIVWPHRTPHSAVMTERSGARSMDVRTVALADMKAAARRAGATLNDTFVAVLADALDRYHALLGVHCPRLRVHMPVNSRNERTADLAGNDFVPARISLRLDRRAPLDDHIRSVRDQLARLRDEPALRHINTVSAAVQRLGRPISRWVIGGMMKGVDVLASNVPGPPFRLYIAGAQITDFWPFGPPAGAALNVTMFSYDGTMRFAITTDTAAVTDRSAFLRCFDEALDDAFGAVEILAAAGS